MTRLSAIMLSVSVAAMSTGAVEPGLTGVKGVGEVFLLPVSNILWRTAPSASFEIPVSMPNGASSATLVVSGRNYRQEYTGIADGMFLLSLPAAGSSGGENVYELTLSFNDESATTNSAKIAVVCGASPGGQAETYVRSADSHKWNYVSTENAVLPIPSGVDALSINGAAVDAGLYDASGWFLFLAQVGTTYNLKLTDDGTSLAEATLFGMSTGLKIIVK